MSEPKVWTTAGMGRGALKRCWEAEPPSRPARAKLGAASPVSMAT